MMELGRVFDEGTVLCLGDRRALGRVEEVFGPVSAPLYALRYTGSAGPPPESAAVGALVFTVEKYAAKLEAELLQTQVAPDSPDLLLLHCSSCRAPRSFFSSLGRLCYESKTK